MYMSIVLGGRRDASPRRMEDMNNIADNGQVVMGGKRECITVVTTGRQRDA